MKSGVEGVRSASQAYGQYRYEQSADAGDSADAETVDADIVDAEIVDAEIVGDEASDQDMANA